MLSYIIRTNHINWKHYLQLQAQSWMSSLSKPWEKSCLFFSNINSKTETVTEVGYVACGPLRTSDVLISAALLFLGSNRFPVSFHCTPANSWIVWTILSQIDTVNFAYCWCLHNVSIFNHECSSLANLLIILRLTCWY